MNQLKIIYYNPDDILTGCNNLDQMLKYFVREYKNLKKPARDQIKSRFENTYMSAIIDQLDNEIKESKKVKKVERVKSEEIEKGE